MRQARSCRQGYRLIATQQHALDPKAHSPFFKTGPSRIRCRMNCFNPLAVMCRVALMRQRRRPSTTMAAPCAQCKAPALKRNWMSATPVVVTKSWRLRLKLVGSPCSSAWRILFRLAVRRTLQKSMRLPTPHWPRPHTLCTAMERTPASTQTRAAVNVGQSRSTNTWVAKVLCRARQTFLTLQTAFAIQISTALPAAGTEETAAKLVTSHAKLMLAFLC